MTDNERVIQALKKVPEKQLLILDLSWQVLNANGELDFATIVDRQREVNLAVAEANAYCQATQRALNALRKLPAQRGGTL